jgi:predicted RNA methylase
MGEAGDEDVQGRIAEAPLPGCVPIAPVQWGDLYRAGYHEGMSHLHHFYTRRNLLAFSALWDAVERFPRKLQPALRFWLLSYNAAHSTIMTRVVAKKGQDDLVVTSGQPGVLYVSGLPVEKNLFAGVRRKINTLAAAFGMIHGHEVVVEVRNASCLDLNLPDGSVDYVFTDPPFGGNIPYAEVNFINEAWLGHVTDPGEEAIVSPHQRKTVDDYRDLLERAFREFHRVLRPDGHATVVFHSATAQVWNSLRSACEQAGFTVANTSVLDKTQGSFKQVRTAGAVKGDPLILLDKTPPKATADATDIWVLANRLADRAALSGDPTEATAQRLYSRLVAHYLEARQDVPIDADAFYRMMPGRRAAYAGQAK